MPGLPKIAMEDTRTQEAQYTETTLLDKDDNLITLSIPMAVRIRILRLLRKVNKAKEAMVVRKKLDP